MRRTVGTDTQYRIGKCRMSYKHASGLSARMRSEKAEASWILNVYDSEDEAFFVEQEVSGKFGVPQLMFDPTKMMRQAAADRLPESWKYIGDNSGRGEAVLGEFGRIPECPLFGTDSDKQQTIKRPFVTFACNLMDGALILPWTDSETVHVKKTDWVPLIVSREDYTGDVVSLDVEDTHLYVADGLVTRNCQAIYGFTGADSDALDLIAEEFKPITSLPLTTTYRCSKAATALAQTWVPHIEAHPDNAEGSVVEIPQVPLPSSMTGGQGSEVTPVAPGDVILCRLTRPLVALAYKLIRAGLPAHVEGRSIGEGLERLATKWQVTDITRLLRRLQSYRERETEKLKAQDRGYAIEALNDKIDTLIVLTEDCETVDQLRTKINWMFRDTGAGRDADHRITLSTIHRFKGREADRVFILGFHELQPSKWARQPWERVQEANLQYVAVTRTRRDLILTGVDS